MEHIKKSEAKHSILFNLISIIFNIIFPILYIPLSLIGIFGCFMADNPPQNPIAQELLYIGILISMSTPIACVASFLLSVSMRMDGRRRMSFLIQLFPFAYFAIAIAFMYVSSFLATILPT